MKLKDLIITFTNIPITVMHEDSDNQYSVVFRGDSRFFRMTDTEGDLWVKYIAPHRDVEGGLFIMVEG